MIAALLHMNGAHGGTTFTDETGKVWSVGGSPQTVTNNYKFETASGLFIPNSYIYTNDHEDFNVGNKNFTISAWFRNHNLAYTGAIYSQFDAGGGGASNSIAFYANAGSNYPSCGIFYGAANKSIISSVAVAETTTFHHLEMDRDGNTLYLFLDGVNVGSIDVTGITVNNSTAHPAIGRPGDYAGEYADAWIDEFYFNNGVALHNSNFTPPSSPYSLMSGMPSISVSNELGVTI